MDRATIEFIMLCLAVVTVFFFVPWVAKKLLNFVPHDPFDFKFKKYKDYDRFFK